MNYLFAIKGKRRPVCKICMFVYLRKTVKTPKEKIKADFPNCEHGVENAKY